jgi:hypothetical protein
MAEQARVVLGMLPPLLGGIVRRVLAGAPGIVVVGDAPDAPSLAALVRAHRPHAVVMEMEGDALHPDLPALLCATPGVAFIGIARDHSRATVFLLRRDRILDLGPRDLVSAILSSSSETP